MTCCFIAVVSESEAPCVLNCSHPAFYLLFTGKFGGIYSNDYIIAVNFKVTCIKKTFLNRIGADKIIFLVAQS